MVAVAMKVLPASKALNVRLGAALLLVGLVVVFYSFSGNQAYDLSFFYLAIVGTVLSLFGAVLLANSRVVSEKRLKAARGADGPREWVRLQCPTCSKVFDTEGVRPFTAVCPHCASSGLIA